MTRPKRPRIHAGVHGGTIGPGAADERPRAPESDHQRAVRLALEAEHSVRLAEEAALVREEVSREHLAAIDRRYANPHDAGAELEALRWGEALERIRGLERRAIARARSDAEASDNALAVVQYGHRYQRRR